MKKVIYVIIALLIFVNCKIPTCAEESIEVPQDVIEISEELGEQYNIARN